MTASTVDGPLSVIGQRPPMIGPAMPTGGQAAIVEYNPDVAPSLLHAGTGIRDPRYMPRIGQGPQTAGGIANQDCGWYDCGGPGIALIDAVPQALAAANVAAAGPATAGQPIPLATVTTAAITVIGAGGLPLPCPVGATVPQGAIALDGPGGYLGGGQSGAFQYFDPTKGLSRCVSVTANAGATGGVVNITSMDIYGQLVHEAITAAAGTTVPGKKAIKYVISAVPAFTDAGHTYSVGTTDIFGLPMRVSAFQGYAQLYWAGALVTAATGYTAAVTTNPATAITGDVRGTYQVQSASNGANRLQLWTGLSVQQAVAPSMAQYQINILGVPQF